MCFFKKSCRDPLSVTTSNAAFCVWTSLFHRFTLVLIPTSRLYARLVRNSDGWPPVTKDNPSPPTNSTPIFVPNASMCGVGTIPFLGTGWFPDVFFAGGEIDAEALGHVKQNALFLRRAHAEPPGAVGAAACAWDAQSLPFRDGTVDAMVVDM